MQHGLVYMHSFQGCMVSVQLIIGSCAEGLLSCTVCFTILIITDIIICVIISNNRHHLMTSIGKQLGTCSCCLICLSCSSRRSVCCGECRGDSCFAGSPVLCCLNILAGCWFGLQWLFCSFLATSCRPDACNDKRAYSNSCSIAVTCSRV